MIYRLPGLAQGAPKRNVIVVLTYLLSTLVGVNLVWPLL